MHVRVKLIPQVKAQNMSINEFISMQMDQIEQLRVELSRVQRSITLANQQIYVYRYIDETAILQVKLFDGKLENPMQFLKQVVQCMKMINDNLD